MKAPANGRGLRAFRRHHGLSQSDIGALFALPQPRVSLIETSGAPLSAEQRALLRAWARRYGGQAAAGAAGAGAAGRIHVPRSGARVKTLREGRNLKQVELASVLGISQPYLSQIEKNDLPLPAKARRLLRAWLGGAGGAVEEDEEDQEEEVELPWSVPRTGGGLATLLKQLHEERGLTLAVVARGSGLGGPPSLKQYTYLDALPKKFVERLRKFLAKQA